jgi:signal transduction histidine kinase
MNIASAISLLSFAVAFYVAALSRRFSHAPGWRDQRYFAFAATMVAAYAALNVPTTMALSDRAVVLASRAQALLAALHSVGWLYYSRAHLGLQPTRVERVTVVAVVTLGVLAFATPWSYPGGVFSVSVPALGFTYRNPVATPFGTAVIVLVLGALLVPVRRFFVAWRRGVPNAGLLCAALSFLLLMGVNDYLVMIDVSPLPYLVDVGFLVPVAAVAYALTSRFVADAEALHALRQDLECEVAERTADLGKAQEALHRAEKLAALGQFAAGVAHEVNNPAAVVNANLHYLAETEGEDLSEDGRAAVRDSIQAMRRIASIVRQLLDAGRVAAQVEEAASIAVRPIADEASRVARTRFGTRALITNEVPEGLHAAGQETLLVQVLVNLIVNAAQAIPEGRRGLVTVRGEEAGDRVSITVEDNGVGMDAEVLRRVFEPFFTTKPFGSGTGLGLAVSRGLLAGIGGDLRLESKVGVGTRAIVDLAAAAAPAARPAAAPPPGDRIRLVEPAPRLRVLLVDDEPEVRTSHRRLLEPRYDVELAEGVEGGLSRLQTERFDIVLCDLMMPGGGGEELYRTLERRAPDIARRVVFVTGGALTERSRQFLESQPQPVLYKPIDLDVLANVTKRL